MESGSCDALSRDEEVEARGGAGGGAVSPFSKLHKGTSSAGIAGAAYGSHA